MFINDIFLTLQGEGRNAGRRAVFVRFSGCNMWSGLENDRSKGNAPCSRWCDTHFFNWTRMDLNQLLERIELLWGDRPHKFVVFTGGEPALQLTDELMRRVSDAGYRIAVETNGSLELPAGDYWRTVSPKRLPLTLTCGNELKLIYPTLDPEQFVGMDFDYFYLQPMDSPQLEENTKRTLAYIMDHPQWQLSIQMHKTIGIP